MKYCAICKFAIDGHGNNGAPLVNGEVCDKCNAKVVKARIQEAMRMQPKINSMDAHIYAEYRKRVEKYVEKSGDEFIEVGKHEALKQLADELSLEYEDVRWCVLRYCRYLMGEKK